MLTFSAFDFFLPFLLLVETVCSYRWCETLQLYLYSPTYHDDDTPILSFFLYISLKKIKLNYKASYLESISNPSAGIENRVGKAIGWFKVSRADCPIVK